MDVDPWEQPLTQKKKKINGMNGLHGALVSDE